MTNFNRQTVKERAEKERKNKEHKQHIQKQKDEAEYNNQVNGHHTNIERNIKKKLLNQGTDFRGRFPIGLKFPERDWNAAKKLASKGGK